MSNQINVYYISFSMDTCYGISSEASYWRTFNEDMQHMFIRKTRLFKYIENFTSKNWKFSDKKILIYFLFLLKT